MSQWNESFRYRTVLITGATGSFGTAYARFVRTTYPDVRIRCFSRDELKQVRLQNDLGDRGLSYLLGDVRDLERLRLAMRGVDLVIHAAALKHVPKGERDPLEFVSTNIMGTANVVRASIDCGVQQAVFLSTDKSCAPANTYGATKLVAEKLFLQSNTYSPDGTRFCVVRWGNVAASRGSVLEVWQHYRRLKVPLPLTHPAMTRFYFTLDDAVRLIDRVLHMHMRGMTVIPHLHAYAVTDMIRAFLDKDEGVGLVEDQDVLTIGIRPGEKLHETLATQAELDRASVLMSPDGTTPYAYAIPPQTATWPLMPPGHGWQDLATPLPVYASDTWPWRLGVTDLQHRMQGLEDVC